MGLKIAAAEKEDLGRWEEEIKYQYIDRDDGLHIARNGQTEIV